MRRFVSIRLTLMLVTLAAVSESTCRSEEPTWSGWLGPNRDGRVEGFESRDSWPDALKLVWRIEVGSGYGTPLVAGNHVYQHARQGENEVIWCVDLSSGKTIWRRQYEVPFKMGGGGEKHGKGPKSCPILADGRLFTMSITGDLIAWDARTGDQLWRSRLGARFNPNQPYWGVSTSPIVDEKRVIAHFGNDEVGALIALDVESGEEIWTQGTDGTSYSSPLLVEIDGVRQVLDWNHRALVAVESKSGRFLWEYPFPHEGSNQNMPTPVFSSGRLILGGENRGVHGLDPKREDDQWRVEARWHQDEVALDMSTAVIHEGRLYGFSHYDSGRLFCLDPRTGSLLWKGPARTGQNVMFL
ncbi:MAG: PQQ-binding-like beta-propeller repeat protein, partial [Rubripirellula sp.]